MKIVQLHIDGEVLRIYRLSDLVDILSQLRDAGAPLDALNLSTHVAGSGSLLIPKEVFEGLSEIGVLDAEFDDGEDD